MCSRFDVLLVLVSLCCAALPGILAQAGSARLLLQGRFGGEIDLTTGLGQLPVVFSWPASSVYVSCVGESVGVRLSTLAPTKVYDAYSRFAFFIDDKQAAVDSSDPNAITVDWSRSGLDSGTRSACTVCSVNSCYKHRTACTPRVAAANTAVMLNVTIQVCTAWQ